MCVYKVRAKLFRLETREESARRVELSRATSDLPASSAGSKEEANGTKGGEPAGKEADGDSDAPGDTDAADETSAAAAAPSEAAPAASSEAAPAAAPDDAAGAAVQLEPRWSERGVGQLRLLLPKSQSSASDSSRCPRLVMRVEHVGRLILNEMLLPSTAPVAKASETSLRLVLVDTTKQPRSYLIRVKMAAEAEATRTAINSHIPPKKS